MSDQPEPQQTDNRPRTDRGEESAPDELQQPGSVPEGLTS